MGNSNIRVLPRVCKVCKDFIFTPISDQLCIFENSKRNNFIEVCRKCKDKDKLSILQKF